ncbi:MAG: acyl-CoA thioesterase II [Caulobacteraceae bacterium]|nr:acyl-CoA thioesterase II [Caulobacteraceae bacterium]
MKTLKEALELERIELNLFRGFTVRADEPRIFGGQVIAQSLLAAYQTVEGRLCHSLHAYFIRPGDPTTPILFEVDRARDGGSFTTRRVTAVQHGRQIFNLAASFQASETGPEHQAAMPQVADADTLDPDQEFQLGPDVPELLQRLAEERLGRTSSIEIRSVHPPRPGFTTLKRAPTQQVWMRPREPLPDDPIWHQVILAYASDMALLSTSVQPHGLTWDQVFNASLDHGLWFHAPVRFDDWMLYDMDSPSARGGRCFNRGALYSRDGVLVASTAQEGLLRMRKP